MTYKGGKLPVSQIKQFLNATYDKNKVQQIDDFKLDTDLSTETVKIYWNGSQCVFAIRGTNPTASDWSNNLAYALGDYKKTPRFQEAEQAYKKAVDKYGEKSITVLGHSQGGGSASFFPNSKEIITLNRAYKGEAVPSNEYDIHSSADPVSTLLNIRKPPHDIKIQSTSWNPLTNHAIDILDLLPSNQMIGQGLKKDNGLTDTQIIKLCKFYNIPLKGIMLPKEFKNIDEGNYVINLNGQSHWTGLIKDCHGVYYWDSFGFPMNDEIEKLVKSYMFNGEDIQDINSTSCGYYTIAFLKFMNGKPNKHILYPHFINLFSNDTKKNERILKDILE